MNKEQILKEQIKELEKLIELKDKRIAELESRQVQVHSITSVWQITECEHEYPVPWNGTLPPSCKKCGKPAEGWNIITCNADDLIVKV